MAALSFNGLVYARDEIRIETDPSVYIFRIDTVRLLGKATSSPPPTSPCSAFTTAWRSKKVGHGTRTITDETDVVMEEYAVEYSYSGSAWIYPQLD